MRPLKFLMICVAIIPSILFNDLPCFFRAAFIISYGMGHIWDKTAQISEKILKGDFDFFALRRFQILRSNHLPAERLFGFYSCYLLYYYVLRTNCINKTGHGVYRSVPGKREILLNFIGAGNVNCIALILLLVQFISVKTVNRFFTIWK